MKKQIKVNSDIASPKHPHIMLGRVTQISGSSLQIDGGLYYFNKKDCILWTPEKKQPLAKKVKSFVESFGVTAFNIDAKSAKGSACAYMHITDPSAALKAFKNAGYKVTKRYNNQFSVELILEHKKIPDGSVHLLKSMQINGQFSTHKLALIQS